MMSRSRRPEISPHGAPTAVNIRGRAVPSGEYTLILETRSGLVRIGEAVLIR
jgi:hypothetical protein